MIGSRIQQARKALGWSLATLAERAGGIVTRQALCKYENDQAVPGSDVLLALGRALDVSVEFFFRPARAEVTLSGLACRKRATLGKRRLDTICAQAKDRVERCLELEGLFPEDRFPKFRGLTAAAARVAQLQDVERLAVRLRQEWKLGLDAVESMTELLEDCGVKVITWKGVEDDLDGFACWANGNIPVVVVKAGVPGDRQRSNLAHELGHLVMRPDAEVDAEKAAKRFSGAFLVPEETVYRELGRHRHALELSELLLLKRKYGMSAQQWIFRAKNLGIISEACAAGWFRLFRARGWHKAEPGDALPEEKSERLHRLALQAVAEDLASPARAAELADIPLDELRSQVSA